MKTSDQKILARYGFGRESLSFPFPLRQASLLCISTNSSNNRGDHEVNWGKQSCTPIANALLTSLFGCTRTFYFRGDGGSHGGTLPSQWEVGLLVSAHKKSQSAADAFAQVCGSSAGAGTPVHSDHVTYFAHIK